MTQAAERIYPAVIEQMQDAILEAQGREVLFVGRIDAEGRVRSVIAAARGDESSVPALSPHMEKGDVVLHNHPKSRGERHANLRPSRADLGIASELGNQGIGFFIVDSEVSLVYVVAEPVQTADIELLDEDALAGILEPGGGLSRKMGGYEARKSQIDMLRFTCRAFNEGGIAIAEAGTGVGKSLAYLLPSLAWVCQNEERVVISTATINLQEQLMDKDIPLVRRLLGRDVPAVLVKGRGNYLCRRRLRDALEEKTLFDAGDSALEDIGKWSKESPSGSRSDLPFFPGEGVWSGVCCEADNCLGLRCAYREKCFLLKARRDAAAARILVVNHHLLFADLALRIRGKGYNATAVLPPFHRLVCDEAHNIENSATSFFSESISKLMIHRAMSRLLHTKGSRRSGLYPKLSYLAPQPEEDKIPALITAVRAAAESLDAAGLPLVMAAGNFRLTGDTMEAAEQTLTRMRTLQRAILTLVENLNDIMKSLNDEDSESPEACEMRMLMKRLEDMAGVCEQFRSPGEKSDRIFWIERKYTHTGDIFLNYVSTPLYIGDLMREAVYEPFDTIVFTSATLTVNKSFRFWRSRLGLSGREEPREEAFDSPFNYKERVLLGVPDDAPPPESSDYRDYLAAFVTQAILAAEGGALVLFTSYELLMKTCAAVRPALDKVGITVFRQGDDQRSRLLRCFTQDISSVLFATDSFWEGVDAPGDTLRLVIICRLPFRVPTEPILLARMEAIQRKGGNPFIDLSLPEAVMKFKQGFGRLMRRTADHGVVLVSDGRIISKSYGSLFISSLPETRRSIKSTASLMEDIENFLARTR
ncbi:MAG: helicase c2 [Spirochaetales bacterium]|jgi:ATP-dependent DNA helicase DinG|nr:helicase c2 [Spirochaetales bacterium]